MGDATLYTFDRFTNTFQVIATSGASDDPWMASMSNDGRFTVFQSDSDALDLQVGGVANHTLDIFVFDRQANNGSGGIVGITDRSDFQANYGSGALGSGRASISPDGRFVIFASDATNLVAGDTNGHGDTFVYNLQTHSFTRVSLGPDGALQGDSDSILGADISFGGIFAAFGSTASNFLVPPESDQKSDVFIVDRTAGTAGAVIEDVTTPGTASGTAPANTLSTHGAFSFNDVDLIDVHTVSVLPGVAIDTSSAPAGFVVPAGGFGTLTPSVIDSTNTGHGQIAWDFVVDNAAVQGLNAFQQIRQTYTVQISDGHGGTVTQNVTIVIAGVNDAAVIAGATTGHVIEAGGVNNATPGTPTATGTLTDTDVDNAANSFQAVPTARISEHGFGTFTMTAGGAWTYALNNNNATVQALNAGAHLTDTFTVRTIDGTSQQVTVTIDGTNDAPVLANVGPAGTTTEAIPNLLDANVAVSDVDLDSLNGGLGNYAGASLQVARSVDPGTHQHDIFGFNTAGASFTVVGNTLVSGGLIFATFTHPTGPGSGTGILTINFTSQQTAATTALVNNVIDHITYTNDNDDPPGSPTLVYTFADGSGGTATGSIAVTLTKVNDAPNLTPDAPAVASYTENADPTPLLAIGAVSDPDIDGRPDETPPNHFSGGNFHVQITNGLHTDDQIVLLGSSGFTVNGSLLQSGSNTVGTISGLGTGDVHVTDFTDFVTPDIASQLAHAFGFQSLSENPSADDRTVTFTFNDGGHNGGGALTDTVTQVVHVIPVNDPAVITGNLTGEVTEAGDAPPVAAFGGGGGGSDPSTTGGQLFAADVDNLPNTFQPVTTASQYGSFTLLADGNWTYTLDNSSAVVQALNVNDHPVDTFTVQSVDGTEQVVSITINGTNDSAVITGNLTGEVIEAGDAPPVAAFGGGGGGSDPSTTGGQLFAADVDNLPNTFQPVTTASQYGSFTLLADGNWTYTLNNSSAVVQALNVNDHPVDTFTVQSVDGTEQVVSITINGTNDSAVITGNLTGEVTEAGNAPPVFTLAAFGGGGGGGSDPSTTGGQLFAADVDNLPNTFQPVTTTSQYGTFTLLADGNWTYTLDDSSAALQALNVDDHPADTFTVQSVDGTEQVVSITINGTNDEPELTLSPSFSVTDQFLTQDYGANWTEANDGGGTGGGATGGEFQLAHDGPLGNTGTFQIKLTDSDAEIGSPDTLSRTIDLSGLTSATLTFDYRRDIPNGESDDRFLVLASSDGVNFTQIGNIGATGNGSFVDGAYQTFTFDLTAFISDHTTIRFSVGDDVDDGDIVYVDNINFSSVPSHFTEGGAPVSLGLSSLIADVDNTDMQSARVVLANAHDGDSLFIDGAPGSTSGTIGTAIDYLITDNNGSITIEFSGAASIADYQAAIDSVRFANSSADPSTDARTFEVTVNDGAVDSNTETASINVTAVNDAPVTDLNGGNAPGSGNFAAFTEQTPVLIDESGVITDVDSADLASMTVRLTNRPNGSAESLSLDPTAAQAASGLSVSYSSSTAILSISGAASLAIYQDILNGILYNNTSDTPNTANRSIAVVVNDGENNSTSHTVTLSVAPVNDAPVIGGLGTLAYTENQTPRIIDSSVTVSDVDSANFNGGSLTVLFAANGTSDDQLAISSQGTSSGQISVNGANVFYNPTNGTPNTLIGTWSGGADGAALVINFTSSVADTAAVDALIQRITYANSSDSPSTAARTVTFALNDGDGGPNPIGSATATINVTAVNDAPVAHNDVNPPAGNGWVLNPDNGHYYRLITTEGTWDQANATATSDGAYLATITSQAEQNFIANLPGWNNVRVGAWTGGETTNANPGGSDPGNTGQSPDSSTWFWAGGPEANSALTYFNWNPGEPNGGFESSAANLEVLGPNFSSNHLWNDVRHPTINAGFSRNGAGLPVRLPSARTPAPRSRRPCCWRTTPMSIPTITCFR